jgi:DNA-binding transcriptional MerR regulator
MRIRELSARSGVPIPTIKYYLREGLLEPGEATAPNQADYDQHHLERLALIRALREATGLPIATLQRVFAAMDSYEEGSAPEHLTIAVRELSEPLTIPDNQESEFSRARSQLTALLDVLRWDVDTNSPGYDDLLRALVTIHKHLPDLGTDVHQLLPYATAARTLADSEIPASYDPALNPAEVLRFSVLGTVLFEPVLLALRKLAHVDRIRKTAAATQRRQRR